MAENQNFENQKKAGFISRHHRLVSTIVFIAGFIWDGATLTFVDLSGAAVILGCYLAVIAAGIIIYQAVTSRHREGWKRKIVGIIPYVIQFMFGTLFNASLIFYTRSAEISASWPFLLFLLLAIFSNELLRKKQDHITFQIVLFFLAEFLYFVFALPIISGRIGSDIFILSGLISLAILAIVVFVVSKVARERSLETRTVRILIVIVFYSALNYCYFTNLIPPIPLALKDSGIFHSVTKVGADYVVSYEPAPQYEFWRKESDVFNEIPGQPIYVWSAIFAPSAFNLPIYHQWYYFDQEKNQWILSSKIDFQIIGGRQDGYRGYTFKRGVSPGKWRVDITTGSNQRLGSISFTVVLATSSPILETGSM